MAKLSRPDTLLKYEEFIKDIQYYINSGKDFKISDMNDVHEVSNRSYPALVSMGHVRLSNGKRIFDTQNMTIGQIAESLLRFQAAYQKEWADKQKEKKQLKTLKPLHVPSPDHQISPEDQLLEQISDYMEVGLRYGVKPQQVTNFAKELLAIQRKFSS